MESVVQTKRSSIKSDVVHWYKWSKPNITPPDQSVIKYMGWWYPTHLNKVPAKTAGSPTLDNDLEPRTLEWISSQTLSVFSPLRHVALWVETLHAAQKHLAGMGCLPWPYCRSVWPPLLEATHLSPLPVGHWPVSSVTFLHLTTWSFVGALR